MKYEYSPDFSRDINKKSSMSDTVHLATVTHEMLAELLIKPFKADLEKKGEFRLCEEPEFSLQFCETEGRWSADVFMKRQPPKKIFIGLG